MISNRLFRLSIIILFLLIAISSTHHASIAPAQQSGIRIVERNPVVNEGNRIALTAVDSNGQPIAGVMWQSGSEGVAKIDSPTGMVTGVQRGFATVTARRASGETDSVFVAVARVESNRGAMVPGDAKMDMGGRFYITNPTDNVILRKNDFSSSANIFSGRSGMKGFSAATQKRTDALFNVPTAVGVDNGSQGGVYVADSANHSIRKIGFDDQVTTIIGMGMPGRTPSAPTPFSQAMLSGPRGVAVDNGGNLFIADTENHAIYIADFSTKMVKLLAGAPGTSGKADGSVSAARFNRPTSIALNSDGRTIAVADEGNRRVRLITRDGMVTTLSSRTRKSLAAGSFAVMDSSIDPNQNINPNQTGDEFDFDSPQSVSFDGTGNIYVVDNRGVQVVTFPTGQLAQLLPLAQPAVSFGQAVSVTVQGTQAVVLDTRAGSNDDAVKIVTVGAPAIASLAVNPIPPILPESTIQPAVPLEGGMQIVLRGGNFAPESQVVLGDKSVDAMVMSATEIRFMAPQQSAPGKRTVSVRTRGGVAQVELSVTSKPVSQIKDGDITTIAGGVPFSGDGGSAVNAVLNFLKIGGIALDSAGNLFIADSLNNRVRRVDNQTGVITAFAGNGIAGFSGDGGPAVGASLNGPESVAVDAAGNLFIADTGNNRVRKVDSLTGLITTFAGNDAAGSAGDGGPAANANLRGPISLAIDQAGNIFISDSGNNRIRRVDAATGIITAFAGNGTFGFGGDGGPAANARLASPGGIAIDGAGNLFIADTSNIRVRRIDPQGIINTAAGNGSPGFGGDNGLAIGANLSDPQGVAVDALGNLFIADAGNNRIRRVDLQGIITTFAGSNAKGFDGDGKPAAVAKLNNPASIAVDGSGNLFIADNGNSRIRQVSSSNNIITTIAGSDLFVGDGSSAVEAIIRIPASASIDSSGNIFIADAQNNRIRRIDPQGIMSTFAGNGAAGFAGDNGPASQAQLNQPSGIAIDSSGNLFIADTGNNRIRRVAPNGIIVAIAGNGSPGFGGDGGPAANALLNGPQSVAIDREGNILIADTGNNRVRRIDRSGIIRTVAGNGSLTFNGDKIPAVNASLNSPFDVAVDKSGNIYIADSLHDRIRIVLSNGMIDTAAGNGQKGFNGDGGLAVAASLFEPRSVFADDAGNIFISDASNNLIRKVDAKTKIITSIAGTRFSRDYLGDNGPAIRASMNISRGMAADSAGNLIFADSGNNALRAVRGAAAAAGGQSSVAITGVVYGKPNLFIDGSGFGSSPVVAVNGTDVSRFIKARSNTSITVKGGPKKLNLKKGPNQIVVTAGGAASNAFTFIF